MTISHKRFQATVASYRRGGSGGRINPEYVKQPSSLDSGKWWCALMEPSGHEHSPGMKEEHVVDVIAVFGPSAPITENGAFQVGETQYYIRAILDRKNGHDDQQVYGQRAERTLSFVDS